MRRHGASTNVVPLSSENVRLTLEARHAAQQHVQGGRRQMQRFRAGLAVRQASLAALEIDPFPAQPKHLAKPGAREYQQLDRGHRIGRAVIKATTHPKGGPSRPRTKTARAVSAETVYVTTRVAAVRALAQAFGK
jgi:hypothetical protein